MDPRRWRGVGPTAGLLLVVGVAAPAAVTSLEADAADRFFNVSRFDAGIPFTAGKAHWSERCLRECKQACLDGNPPPRTRIMNFLGWSKDEDCTYRCTHACLGRDVQMGGRVWKYRGRWPHTRICGVNEPAAVVFSLANLAAHLAGSVQLRNAQRDAALLLASSGWTTS
mmetsp:Transcript_21411/g.48305  ORF Transcript_21411/g.48305 Transcript_21411/m.48305 type:complete len:169 (-) Transcript_21411:50-556(-)